MKRPEKLFHVTTRKKLDHYKGSKRILCPVRGFTTLEAAKEWANHTGRNIILELPVNDERLHKLPDHHNQHGQAWWLDEDVLEWKCVWIKDVPSLTELVENFGAWPDCSGKL